MRIRARIVCMYGIYVMYTLHEKERKLLTLYKLIAKPHVPTNIILRQEIVKFAKTNLESLKNKEIFYY